MNKKYFSILLLTSSLVFSSNVVAMDTDNVSTNEFVAESGKAKASDLYKAGKAKTSDLYEAGKTKASGLYKAGKAKTSGLAKAGKTKIVNGAKVAHSFAPYSLRHNPMKHKLYAASSLVPACIVFKKVYDQSSSRNKHNKGRAALLASTAGLGVLKGIDLVTGYVMNKPKVQLLVNKLTAMMPSFAIPAFIAKRMPNMPSMPGRPTMAGTKAFGKSVAKFVSDNKVTKFVTPYVKGRTGKTVGTLALTAAVLYGAKQVWNKYKVPSKDAQ